jgi:hypothetical protein
MPIFFEGHRQGEDLFGSPGAASADDLAAGFVGAQIDRGSYSGGPAWSPDGTGHDVINNWKQAGTSAYDKDVARYRGMGAEGQARQAVQLDQGPANAARARQMGALSLLQNQATGAAPSAAAIMAQRANQNAAQGAASQTAGAKRIGSGIVAANSAGGAAANAMLQANAQNAALRAQEMSQGQNAFSGAATGMRGQDIGAATTNAQLEAQQRALNEKRQQEYEQLGFDTRKTQQQAAIDWQKQLAAQANAHARQRMAEQAEDDAVMMNAVNMGVGATVGVMGSDPRMKQNVVPMGSLSRLMYGGGR